MIRRKQTLIEVLDERWKFPAQKRVKTQIEEVSGAGRYISSSNILGEAPSFVVVAWPPRSKLCNIAQQNNVINTWNFMFADGNILTIFAVIQCYFSSVGKKGR